jgi:hypothetical protein
LELVIGKAETYNNLSMPLQYIMALQALMYSMGFAGSYVVIAGALGSDSVKARSDTLQVPLQQCLTHLADAQKFVSFHSGKAADNAILNGLRKIDETIREKWAESFRTTDLSFGAVIDSTAPFAATLWMAPGAVGPPQHQNQHQNSQNKNQFQNSQKGNKGGNKGDKNHSKGGSHEFVGKLQNQGKGPKGGSPFQQSIRSVKADSSGKLYCKAWNDDRPGVNGRGCHFGASCTSKHTCDAMLPSGQACDGAHKRCNHKC